MARTHNGQTQMSVSLSSYPLFLAFHIKAFHFKFMKLLIYEGDAILCYTMLYFAIPFHTFLFNSIHFCLTGKKDLTHGGTDGVTEGRTEGQAHKPPF